MNIQSLGRRVVATLQQQLDRNARGAEALVAIDTNNPKGGKEIAITIPPGRYQQAAFEAVRSYVLANLEKEDGMSMFGGAPIQGQSREVSFKVLGSAKATEAFLAWAKQHPLAPELQPGRS